MSVFEQVCHLKILPETLCPNGHESDPDVRGMIARIAAEKIPALQGASDLVSKLATPVAIARDYARSLVRELGEPKRVDKSLWTRDPFIPVLFATPREGMDVLKRAPTLKAAFGSAARECFFLMIMHRHEFEILGSELDGEIIKRGVLQTVVSFEDHAIPIAAPSIGQARTAIAAELVLFLAGLTPSRLRQADAIKAELRHSETLLKAQLDALERASKEFRPLAVPPDLRGKLSQGRAEFQALKDKLAALPRHPEPARYLELVQDVLRHPHEHIQVERVTMRVQDFSIKAPKDKGREIQFIEFRTGGEQRMAVLFASMTRDMAAVIWPDLADAPAQS